MSVQSAIGSLDCLIRKLDEMRAGLADEASEISELWEGLGRVGGQRDDHGAQLLARLRSHLRNIGTFCGNVQTQIDGLVADPFQE